MKLPNEFEMAEGYVRYTSEGKMPLDKVTDIITTAIKLARENGIKKLLIDTTKLTGFATPKVYERFEMAEAFASKAGASVKVAIIARVENIDPKRFGVLVATNRGLTGNVFTTEAEAVSWLMG